VLSKPLWESALRADFHQRRQFPQALRFFLFCSVFLSLCLAPVFHRKSSRHKPLGATIPNLVDLQHPPFAPSSCAFHFPKVDPRWRLIAQGLMWTFVIVKSKIAFEIGDCFQHIDVILQINLFVFHCPP
jgi:hypothetical protein